MKWWKKHLRNENWWKCDRCQMSYLFGVACGTRCRRGYTFAARHRRWLDIRVGALVIFLKCLAPWGFGWHFKPNVPPKLWSDLVPTALTTTATWKKRSWLTLSTANTVLVVASGRPVIASRKTCRCVRILKRRDPRSLLQMLYFDPISPDYVYHKYE